MSNKKLDRKMMSEHWISEKGRQWTTKEILYFIQFGKCFYCLCPLDKTNWSIDHIVPLSKGGENNFTNKVLSCCCCNGLKGSNKVNKNWIKARIDFFNLGAKGEVFKDIN